MIPKARASVACPDLWRPDWLKGAPRDPTLLWLDKNENRDPAQLALVSEVMSQLNPQVLATYPEAASLYKKLGAWAGVDPRCLLLTPGSDGAIRMCFETFVSDGDAVVITSPSFAMYSVYGQMFGARTTAVSYRPSNAGPVLDVSEIVSAIQDSQPRLVCLPNPDSPTGTTFSETDLCAIIEAAADAEAAMLIDEAYHPFHTDTVVPWIKDYPHLIVARTTAKAWGMAGLRIGYAVASPEVAAMMHKMRPMYECSTIAMAAFEAMLDHIDETMASVKRLEDGKALFLSAMEDLGLRVLRGKGNFMHVAFGVHADNVHKALEAICYYRRDFDSPSLKGFSRFSSTTPTLFEPVVVTIRGAVKGTS